MIDYEIHGSEMQFVEIELDPGESVVAEAGGMPTLALAMLDGEHAAAVRDRLEVLARNLYGEVVTYQGIGDHINALERIQEILTHAPDSQAAQSLRDRAVIDS